jgi:hypothetical protein
MFLKFTATVSQRAVGAGGAGYRLDAGIDGVGEPRFGR